ncbi:MAG: STAS/SEC14 domain-containing protein [Cyanobacteria bacterium P01_E01_bin.42]
MPTLKIEAQLSKSELLQAAEQLSSVELEQFVQEILAISAKRKAPNLSHNESDLLSKINQGIDGEIQQRYNLLIAKRQAETLTDEEYQDLLDLTHKVEEHQATRLKYLSQLAQFREISLSQLVVQLGIQPRNND